MLTAKSALSWEIRRALFPALLIAIGLSLFFCSMPAMPGISARLHGVDIPLKELSFSRQIQFPMTVLNLILCLFVIGQAIGMSPRQYPLPISSQTLATVRLIPGALACAGVYIVTSNILNLLFYAGWPSLGPALTYGVSFMVVYTVIALFRGNDHRIALAGLSVGIVLLFWIGGHYGPRWWLTLKHDWPDVSASELLILALAAATSWCGLVAVIDRDRRGAGWGRIVHRTAAASQVSVAVRNRPSRRFMSAATAYFWQEWRLDGWLVCCVVVGIQILLATISTLSPFTHNEQQFIRFDHQYEFAAMVGGFLPACVVLPWFLGLTGKQGIRAYKNQFWPTGESTLPLSDTALGWIYFARVIASSLVAMVGVLLVSGVWYLGTELVAVFFKMIPDNRVSLQLITSLEVLRASAYIGIMALTLWLTAGLSCAATLTGRRWIAAIPLLIIGAWFVIGSAIVLLMPYGSRGMPGHLFEVFITIVLALCVLWMLLAYIFGVGYEILKVPGALFGMGVGAFALALGLTIVYLSETHFGASGSHLTVAPFVQLVMLFSLAAAPPALIPLATYYNRHR
jgi:hypothetical protein